MEFYQHPQVLSLADLPDLKKYPARREGRAVKLAFSSAPQDFGIAGPARRPVSVLVQDAGGRTVREGSFEVTLGSAFALRQRTVTAASVNGVATFADLAFDRAATNCTLIATSPDLQRAESAVFSVGPGSGVLRESWSDPVGAEESSTASRQREIVRKAFEVPVRTATNFQARFMAQLIPPQTGEYQFWIANEHLSELWLSTDATPAKKVKIAEVRGDTPYVKWPHTHEASSALVKLAAGKRYHLEVLQRQTAGSTHLSVRWRLPDGTEERPIPASRLAPPEPIGTDSKPTQPR